MTPSEKRLDDDGAREVQAAAAPPGFGPAVVRTAMARGTTFRTRPQLVQVSIAAAPE